MYVCMYVCIHIYWIGFKMIKNTLVLDETYQTQHHLFLSMTIEQALQVTSCYHRNVPLNLTIDESLKFLIEN